MKLWSNSKKSETRPPCNASRFQQAGALSARKCLFYAYRPLPLCLTASAAGIFADAVFLPPTAVWGVLFLSFALLSAVLFGDRLFFLSRCSVCSEPLFFRGLGSAAVLGLVFAFFGFYHQARWNFFPKDEIGFRIPREGGICALEAVIRTTPSFYPSASGDRADRGITVFTVSADRVKHRGNWENCSGKLRVTLQGDCSAFRIGDTVRLTGTAFHILGPENPGGADYAFRNRAEGILIQFRAETISAVVSETGNSRFPVSRFFEQIRSAARKQFSSHLSAKNAEIASAAILGLRSGLDDGTLETFRRTGTAHLLAISGLHVSLVSLFLISLMRVIPVSMPPRLSALISASMIWCYVMMTGMQPPALRAAVLFWTFCAALFFRRKKSFLNSFALSAIVVLLINPAALFLPGVHFSFLAAAVFTWFLDLNPRGRLEKKPENGGGGRRAAALLRFRNWLRFHPILFFFARRLGKFAVGFGKAAAASFIVELVLLPIILADIHLFTPIGAIVNPLIWLPFQIALILAISLLIFGSVPLAGPALAFLTDQSFSFFRAILEVSESVPHGFFYLPGPPLWWLAVFYFFFGFWTLFPELRPRYRVIFLSALAWVLTGWMVSFAANKCGELREETEIDLLAVGHGSASLIFYPNRTVLFDCGSQRNPRRAARSVESDLFVRGRNSIDLLLISHADSDHFNGVLELIGTIPIRRIAFPPHFFEKESGILKEFQEKVKDAGIPCFTVQAGDDLSMYGADSLTVLHPENKFDISAGDSESNASSLVLRLDWKNRVILFTGDIDTPEPPPFISNTPLYADAVTVPHHGGKSETSDPLLRWALPRYAAVSETETPSLNEKEAAWEKLVPGMKVMNTGEYGALQIRIGKPDPGETKGSFTLMPYRYPAAR